MPRDWSEEKWIKLFLADSAAWVSMTWQARGLYVLLQRVADRTGCIDLGSSGLRSIAGLVRANWDDISRACDELIEAGYIAHVSGQIVLPEHIAQQESRASDAARQRESRIKKRGYESSRDVTQGHTKSRNVTQGHGSSQDVTIRQDKNRLDQIEKKKAEQIARAREDAAAATSDRDPKSVAIEEALRSSPRFASLDASSLSDALLGSLGTLGMRLTPEHARSAVSLAALELEDGANERRCRQVLGWKLKDAVDPTKAKKHPVQVQGQGEDLDRFLDNINNGRPAWA